jgi:heptose-I-phosphate ethanolaminephosphotransferase
LKFIKNIVLGIKEYFPLYFVVLALAPLLVGFFIESALVDFRYVLINLVWLLVFSIPFVLTQKKYFLRIGIVLFFIIGIIEISHWLIIKSPLNATSIMVIANSNLAEANEFMEIKGGSHLLWVIPIIALFILGLRKTPSAKLSTFKNKVGITLSVFVLVFLLENAVHGRLIRKGLPHTAKVGVTFFQQIGMYQDAMKVVEPKAVDIINHDSTNAKTIVLVIGESESRRHMSLYGYNRQTTPLLEARTDIYALNNVITPFSNTVNCVLSSLSEARSEKHDSLVNYTDIIDVFHSAGFKTYWLSNQPPTGVWENFIAHLARKADDYTFVNQSGNTSFEATYIKSFDEKLFNPFQEALEDSAHNKLIVLHLMGNHTSYSKRYPEAYQKFSGEGEVDGTQAHYDNSVLYNDYVVNSLLNHLEKTTTKQGVISSAIYLSDHGENVYDENGNCGHDYSSKIPKSNVEIPFVVWFSPKFIAAYPHKSNILSKRINTPYMSDDLFHSLLDLGEISYDQFYPERSIFNSNFDDKRSRILETKENYDLK